MRARRSPFAVAIAAMALLADPAAAMIADTSEAPDPRRGKAIAEEWCSVCHVTSPEQAVNPAAGAPSFVVVASNPDTTIEGLVWFMNTQKLPMTTFTLTDAEVGDVAAYIFALGNDPAWRPAALREGHDIAARLCSGCHAIANFGPSPVAASPPFRTLATKWPVHYLEEALAEGISVGHGRVQMPEFRFEPDEIGALLGYIATLAPE